MSKDQVWKIIFFFHTNRSKKMFSRLENDKLFSILFRTAEEHCNYFFYRRIASGLTFSFNISPAKMSEIMLKVVICDK